MAITYTDFAALQNAAINDQSQAPNLKAYGGNLHFLEVQKLTYVAATADPLYIARLLKGARLIPELCSIDYGDPGDALTGMVGFISDDGSYLDADAYATALTLGAAAGRKNFIDSTGIGQGAAFLTPVKFTDDVWIYATWGTATNAVSHTQTWHLAYTLG